MDTYDIYDVIENSVSYKEKLDILENIGEEVISREELINLCSNPIRPIAYDGFEPSGIPHIAQVLMKVYNVNQMIKCGCKVKFWIADWFAQLNNKMGGDLEKIQIVGKYMIEVWKACGIDTKNVEFLWASEEINKNSELYWNIVMDISRKFNITRIKRCIPALGRGYDKKELLNRELALIKRRI